MRRHLRKHQFHLFQSLHSRFDSRILFCIYMFVIKVYVAALTFDATYFHLMQVVDVSDIILKSVSSKFR